MHIQTDITNIIFTLIVFGMLIINNNNFIKLPLNKSLIKLNLHLNII